MRKHSARVFTASLFVAAWTSSTAAVALTWTIEQLQFEDPELFATGEIVGTFDYDENFGYSNVNIQVLAYGSEDFESRWTSNLNFGADTGQQSMFADGFQTFGGEFVRLDMAFDNPLTDLGGLVGIDAFSFDSRLEVFDPFDGQYKQANLFSGGFVTANAPPPPPPIDPEPPAAVPVPAAAWLFGSALTALVSVSRRRHSTS